MGRMSDEAIRIEDELLREDAAYKEWSDGLHAEIEDDYYAPLAEAEVIRRTWGGTLHLPEQQAATRQLTRGIAADIKRWQREPVAEWTWPEGGPMTSEEDFAPIGL